MDWEVEQWIKESKNRRNINKVEKQKDEEGK